MKINDNFKNLIPPLSESEYKELEDSILAEGCRDPLIVWNDTIVDGHHRYEICTKHGLPFRTQEKEFKDEQAAKIWIIANQLARRNISEFARIELALKRKDILLEQGRKKQKQTLGGYKYNPSVLSIIDKTDEEPHNTVLSIVDKTLEEPHDTRKIIANDLKWSTGKVAMAEQIIKQAPEEVKDKLRRGDISINRVYEQMKHKLNRQDRIEKIIADTSGGIELDAKYPVIYADPPWRYEFSVSGNREIENQYPTMTLKEICILNVPDIANDDCVLFLWATNPKLPEAFEVLKAWGFTYRTNMVWIKDKIGMGYYARQQHELLLIATKGSLPVPEPEARVSSVINAPRTEHSKKPECVYEIIENMYPDYAKVELFARQKRTGWVVWGNEL